MRRRPRRRRRTQASHSRRRRGGRGIGGPGHPRGGAGLERVAGGRSVRHPPASTRNSRSASVRGGRPGRWGLAGSVSGCSAEQQRGTRCPGRPRAASRPAASPVSDAPPQAALGGAAEGRARRARRAPRRLRPGPPPGVGDRCVRCRPCRPAGAQAVTGRAGVVPLDRDRAADVLPEQLAELPLPADQPQRVRDGGQRTRLRVAGDRLRLEPGQCRLPQPDLRERRRERALGDQVDGGDAVRGHQGLSFTNGRAT